MILVALAAFLAVSLLAGCGDTGLTIREGTLMMGSDTTYPPFESVEKGEAVGFDVDLASEIAERLDLRLEVVPMSWEGLIPGLKRDEYDMVMSAMAITEDREEEILFSDPYMRADQSICVAEGSDISSEEDLKGRIVGVERDSTGQFTAERMEGLEEINKFDTIALAFEALLAGDIDAIINDYPVNSYMSKEVGGTEVVAKIETGEEYGIGVNKNNPGLLEEVNRALEQIVEDGTYDEIYEKWFGSS